VRTDLPLIVTAVVGLGILPAASSADTTGVLECPRIGVDVYAGSARDRALVCAGAGRAVAFFRSHGLESKHKIPVTLKDSAIVNHGAHIGLYDARDESIRFLSFAQAVLLCEKQSPFGTPMDEALYTSFATHEVAHALADQHIRSPSGRRLAQEYLAYVAQISTMDAYKRQDILQRYDIGAFANPHEISLTYYALDPNAFGVKVYKHFQTLPDQTTFLHALLAGEVRTGGSPWGNW
jgi:hypothetical protein